MEKEKDGIDYLHPTGIIQYLECSAKYYFSKILRIQSPSRPAPAEGTAVHRTLQRNYEQKISTYKDLPVEEIKDTFTDALNNEFQNVEKKEFVEEKPGEILDRGIDMLERYFNVVAPKIQPVAVESMIKCKFKGFKKGLIGVIDLTEVGGTIADHKTTKRKPSGVTPEQVVQMTAYKLMKHSIGEEITKARIDYLLRRNKENRRAEFLHFGVKFDVDHFLKLFQSVSEAIDKEVFVPNRSHMFCTRRWCMYWNECEKKFGGTVRP